MSRIYSHVNTAVRIIELYKGEMPFSAFLKAFFAREKKYGSRDRRTISSLCYSYFRIGPSVKGKSISESILNAVFLLSNSDNEFLQNEKPEWNENIARPLAEKFSLAQLDPKSIFPFYNDLSEGIDVDDFTISFLIQPDLFVRVRPGKLSVVKNKLAEAQIQFQQVNENCLAFANGTKLESIIDINREVVIQDLNSQRVGESLPAKELPPHSKVWDSCAASGGKSIMAYDLLSDIQLTVSDVRESIIQNLRRRFEEAGIKDYRSFVTDLTNAKVLQTSLSHSKFDLIICDAPCSGSGTWSRTPEQLVFFKQEEITRYSNLQKSIAQNSLPYLKKGGYFLYITCSVFKKENEEVADFIQSHPGVGLVKMELLKGYALKADTMFAALFTRES